MATQDVNSFKFWANKIIPLVYDDSLSYYEFLCKVMQKLNEVIGSVNDQNTTIKDMQDQIDAFIAAERQAREDWELTETANRAAWELQQAQKMAAFELLFVSDYDSTKSYRKGNICRHEGLLYAANGSTTGNWNSAKWDQIVLADYLANYVQTAAANMQSQYDTFLETYQAQFGVANTVGSSTTDVISQVGVAKILNNAQLPANKIKWTTVLNESGAQSSTGNIVSAPGYVATDFMDISGSTKIAFLSCYTCVWYDSNQEYISGKIYPGEENVPEGAAYARCSIANNNVGKAAVYDYDTYYAGMPTGNRDLEDLAFRRTLDLNRLGITNVTQIDRDGVYYYAADQVPDNLPAQASGNSGVIITYNLPSSTGVRCYILIINNRHDPQMYFRRKTGIWTEWSALNSYTKHITTGGSTDFNDFTEPATSYYFNAGDIANFSNKPFTGADGMLYVFTTTDSPRRTMQIAISNTWTTSTNKFFAFRRKSIDGTWNEWSYMGTNMQYRNKVINWLGDSSVAGNDFDEKVCAYFGMVENDYGVGGATIAKKEGGTRHCISESYADMTDECDIIAVSCGSNDFQYDWTPFGTITDTTNDTFYGALNVLCLGLITKYPEKLIFFTTPLKRAQSPYTTQDSQNTYGKTLGDYVNAIKEVCARYSIPVCDVYNESLLNPSIPAQAYLFDNIGTHATATGQAIQARRVIGWLKQLT